jgi:hypothetical protein
MEQQVEFKLQRFEWIHPMIYNDIVQESQITSETSHGGSNRVCVSHFPENGALDVRVMKAIQEMLRNSNPYAISFKHACERLLDDPSPIRLCLLTAQNTNSSNNHKRYNWPSASEVAAIIPCVDNAHDTAGPCDSILQFRNGHLQWMSQPFKL